MSDQYTRDHRHDFLVSLAKVQNALEILRVGQGAEARPAVEDMDIITPEDAEVMEKRLNELRRLAREWSAPFSWGRS